MTKQRLPGRNEIKENGRETETEKTVTKKGEKGRRIKKKEGGKETEERRKKQRQKKKRERKKQTERNRGRKI